LTEKTPVPDIQLVREPYSLAPYRPLIRAQGQGERGWLGICTLGSEGLVSDRGRCQICTNLRPALQGSLLGRKGHKFVQSDGPKRQRTSTHPDFITYETQKLIDRQTYHVGELAEKSPELEVET